MANEAPYLVKSGDGYWWKSDRKGYTNDVLRAGIYTKAEAERIERTCRGRGEKAIPLADHRGEIERLLLEAESRGRIAGGLLILLDGKVGSEPVDGRAALLGLADWIQERFRLAETAKVRLASAPEIIYGEIVERLATLAAQPATEKPHPGSAKHPPMDGSVASIEELPKVWLGLPVRGAERLLQFYDATGRPLLRSEVTRATFPVSYRWEKPREGCQANRDGDCSWGACPQDLDGEPQKTGRHCPLDKRGEQ